MNFLHIKNNSDPEIPAVIICRIRYCKKKMLGENTCEVTITPTYSCLSAMFTIEEDITKVMKENAGMQKW